MEQDTWSCSCAVKLLQKEKGLAFFARPFSVFLGPQNLILMTLPYERTALLLLIISRFRIPVQQCTGISVLPVQNNENVMHTATTSRSLFGGISLHGRNTQQQTGTVDDLALEGFGKRKLLLMKLPFFKLRFEYVLS